MAESLILKCFIFSYFFATVNREEAETLLKSPNNTNGSYLIRYQGDKKDKFVLSVLKADKNQKSVSHYVINKTDRNEFSVNDNRQFKTINKLIEFYSSKNIFKNSSFSYLKLIIRFFKDGNHGLCANLSKPCQKGCCMF